MKEMVDAYQTAGGKREDLYIHGRVVNACKEIGCESADWFRLAENKFHS
jgi:hypothetical protein